MAGTVRKNTQTQVKAVQRMQGEWGALGILSVPMDASAYAPRKKTLEGNCHYD